MYFYLGGLGGKEMKIIRDDKILELIRLGKLE